MGLLAEIKAQGRLPDGLGDVVIGGSAASRAMIKEFEELGVHVNHSWGMTEMSPLGSHGMVPPSVEALPLEEKLNYKQKQGRRCYGVEMKIVDLDGNRQPHDGVAMGELFVRGSGIVSGYFKNPEATEKALDAEGWFGTGDVATIDEDGYLTLRDRAKDLIKSGGEWISSIDLENAAVSHPALANCVAIGVPHPKWDERPILVAVAAGDERPGLEELRAHLAPHFATWQLPDDVIWVESLPMTATGKVSKLTLRQQISDYVHPDLR
jgi:fatty-acyl-CoA synthase